MHLFFFYFSTRSDAQTNIDANIYVNNRLWVKHENQQCKSCLVSLLYHVSIQLRLSGGSSARVFSAEARQGHAAASLGGFTFTPAVTMNESIAVHPNEGGKASSLSRSCVCPSSQTSTLPEVEEGFAGSYLYYYSRTLRRLSPPLSLKQVWGWFLAGKISRFHAWIQVMQSVTMCNVFV